MKYTRLEIKRPFTSFKFKIIFEFCIVIPIIAMVFGAALSKCFIANSISRAKVKALNENKKVISIKNLKGNEKKQNKKLYYLQAGAFSTANNANLIVKTLKNKGINCSAIKDKNLYRVVVDTSDDIKNIKAKQYKLKKIGCITLVKQNGNKITNNSLK